MTTLLAFVFVLGVLVFFHESGHFLIAKWVGVRVKTFSLGFPP
ncbi:MAG TPA: site-2 protease family protein, partial [Vicinamibacteria bacterium]|nr:site-2 protease family protein [Vicinamibacteria bacterium]